MWKIKGLFYSFPEDKLGNFNISQSNIVAFFQFQYGVTAYKYMDSPFKTWLDDISPDTNIFNASLSRRVFAIVAKNDLQIQKYNFFILPVALNI